MRAQLSTVLVSLVLASACGDGDRGANARDASDDASSTDARVLTAEERCFAADSETACGAVDLAELADCTDCWHRCQWVQTHEVERTGDECEHGAARGICSYQRGGEDDGDDLADTCLGTTSTAGRFWIDDTRDVPRVAFLRIGTLTYPGFSACGTPDAPFSRAPECECPCLPGYPGAECVAIDQGFETDIPSGIEYCPGVPHHRVSTPECVDDVSAFACSGDRGACRTDADCAGDDRCLENDGFCTCTASCATDADCGQGEACVCRGYGGPSVCAAASCKTDADCDGTDVCAVSYGMTDERGGCEPKALACRAPFDECDGVRCASDEMCAYDDAAEGWTCVSNDRCYDF
jgi:hypothetical protein